MPAPQLHLSFALAVKDRPGIAPALRRACAAEPVYARLGAIVHDLPYYYGNMAIEAVRYGFDRPALDEPWAYRLHSVRPARFVAAFVRAAAETPGLDTGERLALVGGIASHCALDLALHPLVNYCARRDLAERGGFESVHHRRAEKLHALHLHVERLGEDPIGTARIREWTRVVKGGRRVEAPILQLLRSAFAGAWGDAPSTRKIQGWVRSLRQFGLLVSGPWAARNSARTRRDRALHARYVENERFRLDEFYACAERRLELVANLAHAYFEARDFSAEAERAFVDASTIDDLAEPAPRDLPELPRAAGGAKAAEPVGVAA